MLKGWASSHQVYDSRRHPITEIKKFAVADPRTFDGDPYEVAGRAARQVEAVGRILATVVDGAHVMTRNAALERQLVASGDCDASAYEASAENRRWESIRESVEKIQKDLAVLVKAAEFNPKAPLNG